MAGNTEYDEEKLKEFMIYVLDKRGPCTLDELSTILFIIDMKAYAETGKSITGSTYIKVENPVK